MGTLYLFRCEDCGYQAEVSGGRDVGMVSVTRTSLCRSCRELVDVPIGSYGQEGPIGDPELDDGLWRCPQCGGADILAGADDSLRCPRCLGVMIRGEPTVEWD
jgi:hypothetical protein